MLSQKVKKESTTGFSGNWIPSFYGQLLTDIQYNQHIVDVNTSVQTGSVASELFLFFLVANSAALTFNETHEKVRIYLHS